MSKHTINNYIITEPYMGEKKIEAKISRGFAMVSQKTNLVGLKVLVDAHLADGVTIPQGSKVYIKEEVLYTQTWAKDTLDIKDEGFGGFILVDAKNIVMIGE